MAIHRAISIGVEELSDELKYFCVINAESIRNQKDFFSKREKITQSRAEYSSVPQAWPPEIEDIESFIHLDRQRLIRIQS